VFLVNSCAALILLNLSYAGSYYATSTEASCLALSALLHYLFLASVLALANLAVSKMIKIWRKEERSNQLPKTKYIMTSAVAVTWGKSSVLCM